MKIELTSYNVSDDAKIRIYRSVTVFDRNQLPPVLVELPGNTDYYLDETIPLNTMMYYRIGIVTGDTEVVGPMYPVTKRYYSGPRIDPNKPDSILRGDAVIGRFGTLPLTDVLTLDQALARLPSCTALPGVDISKVEVEKCSYNGNVLFITTEPIIQGSPKGLYEDGALFTYGDGKGLLETSFYNSITTKVMQGKPVYFNNYAYKIRLMTQNEFNDVYIKLFPDSNLGELENRAIGNCIPNAAIAPVFYTQGQTDMFQHIALDGSNAELDWDSSTALYIVLELLNRGDIAYPEPDVVAKTTDTTDRMQFCQNGLVNNRVHYYGGLYSYLQADSYPVGKHISFDTNGENRKVHADLPIPVFNAAYWSADGKLFCFGGAKQLGPNRYSWGEVNQTIQVWTDDGTDAGTWSTLTSNVTFYQGSTATVLTDETTGKQRILVMGSYNVSISVYYIADVEGFDGTFKQGKLSLTSTVSGGGSVLCQFADEVLLVAGTTAVNGITNRTVTFKIPEDITSYLIPNPVVQQGTELPTTRFGNMGSWRDTWFLVTEASCVSNDLNVLWLYQFAYTENRWLKIKVPLPTPLKSSWVTLSTVFIENRLVIMANYGTINDSAVSDLFVVDLKDPLEAELVPLNAVQAVVDRIYPPFAKVRYL